MDYGKTMGSLASISRFCRFLGFENFKEFKRYVELDYTVQMDYSKQFNSMLNVDPQLAVVTFRDELVESIYSTLSPENIEIMPDIVKTIHDSEKVAYFSHHFLWDIGRFFQSKMIMMDKYVEQFLSYDAQLQCARELTKDSLAIICSIGGSYTSRYSDILNEIMESGCKVLMITQNLSNVYLNHVDFVLRCGISNRDDIGKYSVMMVTDYLVMSYMKKYDTH